MMHKARRFCVVAVDSAETLAEKLTQHDWCGCAGFKLGGLLFLNDSTSADGAQEYAVVVESTLIQVESITFGWMKQDDAQECIKRLIGNAGSCGDMHVRITNKIETPSEHGTCARCA